MFDIGCKIPRKFRWQQQKKRTELAKIMGASEGMRVRVTNSRRARDPTGNTSERISGPRRIEDNATRALFFEHPENREEKNQAKERKREIERER